MKFTGKQIRGEGRAGEPGWLDFNRRGIRDGTASVPHPPSMIKQIPFLVRCGWFLAAALGASAPAVAAVPPNIIIILTDDHGFTDLGVHKVDPNVQTPVLDSLANGGALIKYGYSSAPQCVPSRAGLLSGRIQNNFGTRQNGDIYGRIPLPLTVPSIAERLLASGTTYRTGMVGKWHMEIPVTVPDSELGGPRTAYLPGARGFQEYWEGEMTNFDANFNLAGATLDPPQTINDTRNRVIVQGEAAQAFIQRNSTRPFFLYLALFGPHWPRLDATDPFYLNFPVLNYPNYSPELNDIRRFGLGLVNAVDTAVGGVMTKLRALGIEDKTLIFFAGDNGAPPKFWDGMPGSDTVASWTGSENIPLRGEKGSLWEGGMRVPMFVYWKNHIPAGQVINDPVWTLDFTATLLKLASGTVPAEFDGTDILPRVTGSASSITRTKQMFWDWGHEMAMRKGDWKYHRIGNRKALVNLVDDPDELYDVQHVQPAKFLELEGDITAWRNSLPANGQSDLVDVGDNLYVTGVAPGTAVDPRFVIPYANGAAAAYPAPLTVVADPNLDSDGDGMPDTRELSVLRNPYDAADLGFEFATDGDYQGWTPIADGFLASSAVASGMLSGSCTSGQGKFENTKFSFPSSKVNNILVRIHSNVGKSLTFRWGTAADNTFIAARTLVVPYSSNQWQTAVIALKGTSNWDNQTITRMRLNPVNIAADFQVDWIRASSGDYDGDLVPDTYESANGLDPLNPSDGNVDADHDGYTRGQEYVLGTSDSNQADRLQPTLSQSGGALQIQWPGVAGRRYQVMVSPDLSPGSWSLLFDSGTLSASGSQTYSPAPTGATKRFFRILASLP